MNSRVGAQPCLFGVDIGGVSDVRRARQSSTSTRRSRRAYIPMSEVILYRAFEQALSAPAYPNYCRQ